MAFRDEDAPTGSVHDAKVMDNLIREDDRAVFADKGNPVPALGVGECVPLTPCPV